jgi:hypothetical protein
MRNPHPDSLAPIIQMGMYTLPLLSTLSLFINEDLDIVLALVSGDLLEFLPMGIILVSARNRNSFWQTGRWYVTHTPDLRGLEAS